MLEPLTSSTVPSVEGSEFGFILVASAAKLFKEKPEVMEISKMGQWLSLRFCGVGGRDLILVQPGLVFVTSTTSGAVSAHSGSNNRAISCEHRKISLLSRGFNSSRMIRQILKHECETMSAAVTPQSVKQGLVEVIVKK